MGSLTLHALWLIILLDLDLLCEVNSLCYCRPKPFPNPTRVSQLRGTEQKEDFMLPSTDRHIDHHDRPNTRSSFTLGVP